MSWADPKFVKRLTRFTPHKFRNWRSQFWLAEWTTLQIKGDLTNLIPLQINVELVSWYLWKWTMTWQIVDFGNKRTRTLWNRAARPLGLDCISIPSCISIPFTRIVCLISAPPSICPATKVSLPPIMTQRQASLFPKSPFISKVNSSQIAVYFQSHRLAKSPLICKDVNSPSHNLFAKSSICESKFVGWGSTPSL